MSRTRTSPQKVAARVDATLRELGATVAPSPACPTDRRVNIAGSGPVTVRPVAGRVKPGVILFTSQTPHDDVDFFVVWEPTDDRLFVVPQTVCGVKETTLRVELPASRPSRTMHPAAAYALDRTRDGIVEGVWPQPPETLDGNLLSEVVALASDHRRGLLPREGTARLQQLTCDALGHLPTRELSRLSGLSIEQVRALDRAAADRRLVGHDARRGRKSAAELLGIAASVVRLPAAGPFRDELGHDPAMFLFRTAVAATDGSAPAVRRFLVDAGWVGLTKGTVYRRLAQVTGATVSS